MIRGAALICALLCALPAQAQRVVAALNQTRIAISSDFSGSEIFVYGAVAGAPGRADGALGLVVAVNGPQKPVIVRRKARKLGVWINAASARISEAPSYYAVASTGPFYDTISHTEDLRHQVSLDRATRLIDAGAAPAERDAFLEATSRLRVAEGRYVIAEGGVEMIENMLFRASFRLPASISEGVYHARVFLTRDRQVIDRFEAQVSVNKVGFERIVTDLARHRPLLYGFFATFLAMAAGFIASETFRWLRR